MQRHFALHQFQIFYDELIIIKFKSFKKYKTLMQNIRTITYSTLILQQAIKYIFFLEYFIIHLNKSIIYKMGCVVQSDVHEVKSLNDTLMAQIIRLKYQFELIRMRKAQQLEKVQLLLLNELTKNRKYRSKQIQITCIKSNTVFFVQKIILAILQQQSKVIEGHKECFQDQVKLKTIEKSINLLLYCSNFMNIDYLMSFRKVFRQRFPDYLFPTDKDIAYDQVILYGQKHECSPQKQREYIFQFCLNRSVSVEILNQIGHNYTYANHNNRKIQ